MNYLRSFILSIISGLVLILLFFAPWVNINIGGLIQESLNGADLGKFRSIVYAFPVLGGVAAVVAFAGLRGILTWRNTALFLVLLGAVLIISFLIVIITGFKIDIFGMRFSIGNAGWGLWLSVAVSVIISVNGFLNVSGSGDSYWR